MLSSFKDNLRKRFFSLRSRERSRVHVVVALRPCTHSWCRPKEMLLKQVGGQAKEDIRAPRETGHQEVLIFWILEWPHAKRRDGWTTDWQERACNWISFNLSENILKCVFLASLNLWTKIHTHMRINGIKVWSLWGGGLKDPLLSNKKTCFGTSLKVRWLRLHVSIPGGGGLIPGQETKTLGAVWCSKKKKKKEKNLLHYLKWSQFSSLKIVMILILLKEATGYLEVWLNRKPKAWAVPRSRDQKVAVGLGWWLFGGCFFGPFPLPISGISPGSGPYQNLFEGLGPVTKILCLWILWSWSNQPSPARMRFQGTGKKRKVLLERLGLCVLSQAGLVVKLVADSLRWSVHDLQRRFSLGTRAGLITQELLCSRV